MNTSTDRPESALRAWLELGPDRGRPEAIERALAATRRVPQRPRWTYPERWIPVNRALLAAAAALIVVVAGAAMVLRPANNIGPGGSPSPTATSHANTSAPLATTGVVPAVLQHDWVGAPHDLLGTSRVQSLRLEFYFGQVSVSVNDVYGQNQFVSTASFTGTSGMQVTAVSNGCGIEEIGHYTWSLSPGGTLLHLAVVDDACAARSVAFVGDWHAANCKDQTDLCWGDLEAGTYPTLFYAPRLDPSQQPEPNYGGVTFTVPDGWAEAGDHTSDFRLLRSSDYSKEGTSGPVGQSTGIEGWIRPSAILPTQMCAATPNVRVDRTPEGLTSWLSRRDGLAVGAVHDISVDGHLGKWIDVRVAADWTSTCDGSEPTVTLMTEAVGSAGPVGAEPYVVGISGQTRLRMIFLDVGRGTPGGPLTAMVLITAPDQATFDAFVGQAMPIVQSFHFK